MKPLLLLFAVAVAMLMIFACAFGQTAQVPSLVVKLPGVVYPAGQVAKGTVTGKTCTVALPGLTLLQPSQSVTVPTPAPVNLPNFTYTITLTPDQAQALQTALTSGGGSVTGVTISLVAVKP